MTDTLFSATPIATIPLDRLTLPTDNLGPIDPDVVEQLVASIKVLGVLEPITIVELVDGLYEIHDGRHRYLAAGEAGLTEIPYTIREFTDEAERWLSMLAGHLHRRNVDPIAEGAAYARLVELGSTQHELADRVGRSQSHISKRIALATLPAPALEAVAEGRLSISGAEAMARITDTAKVEALAKGTGKIDDWKINEAVKDQERETKRAELRQEQLDAGRTEVGTENYFKDYTNAPADSATHFFVSQYGQVALLVPKTDAPKEAKPPKETAAEKRERIAHEKQQTTRSGMLDNQKAFITTYLEGKVDAKVAEAGLAAWLLAVILGPGYTELTSIDVAVKLLQLTVPEGDDVDPDEAIVDALRTFAESSAVAALKVRLATVAASLTGELHWQLRRGNGAGFEPEVAEYLALLRDLGWTPTDDEQAELDRITTPATKEAGE